MAELKIDVKKVAQSTVDMLKKQGLFVGRWIPVSERLPEDHDWYVIVVKEKSTGYQYIPRIASHNHDNCWLIIDTEDADKDWLDDLECVAWMPLPEPYKMCGGEKE